MRTLAVLPIKSFGAAKSRLAGLLASGSRQAIAQAMFCDTLGSLKHVRGLDGIVVVTGDREAEAATLGRGVQVLRDEAEAGHNAAAAIGIAHAQSGGYDRVLLVPGDAPLLDPAEVDRLLERCAAAAIGVAIVPDRHGTGTNGLLIAPPGGFAPSFGPGSRERHAEQARAGELSHSVENLASLALDVDTPDDLAALSAELEGRRGMAPQTRGALRQLDRSQVGGPTRPRATAAA